MDQQPNDERSPVDYVIEQLWGTALVSPDLRVQINPAADPIWTDVERYWLLPTAERARLLVPHGPASAVRGLVTNYRRLREPRLNAVRAAVGVLAGTGAPLSRSTVAVQRRRSAPASAEQLPLPLVERALGTKLFAAIGVRTSDNRKVTLQLAFPSGKPAGFAKFGWNASTGGLVANESRMLSLLTSQPGGAAVPQVLTTLNYHGNPVCVTSPLPLDVRRPLAPEELPQVQEIYDLLEVRRRDTIASSSHFRRMRDRLEGAASDSVVGSVAGPAAAFAARLSGVQDLFPIARLWHGDLTPWNSGRDGSGRLWIWDWEDAEEDALAGLDSVHWCMSSSRTQSSSRTPSPLAESAQGAAPHLTALGITPAAHGTVASLYVLAVLDRACNFARTAGHWRDALIPPHGLLDLLSQASRLFDPTTSAH